MVPQNQPKLHHPPLKDVIKKANMKSPKPSLSYQLYTDGVCRWCCCICGTIPILFKERTYNIPISLFLQKNHPQAPPFCFISPAADMKIQESDTVDNTGRISLPYLTNWQHPTHNTCQLLETMALTFGAKCPVDIFSNSTGPNVFSLKKPLNGTINKKTIELLRAKLRRTTRNRWNCWKS
uniref:UEV domain-containing protein n=1 Tax=Ditylenchus dipsaci TaxID=166011 RepID=A0A915ED11_9BILA